jgi:hypothetical protein
MMRVSRHPVRVAGAVELLVVPAYDLRHTRQLLRPRNVQEEVVAVDDVCLDLRPLALVQ